MVQWCEDRGFWVEFLKKFYIKVSIEFFSQAAPPVLFVLTQRLLRYIVNIFNIVKLPYFRDGGSMKFYVHLSSYTCIPGHKEYVYQVVQRSKRLRRALSTSATSSPRSDIKTVSKQNHANHTTVNHKCNFCCALL